MFPTRIALVSLVTLFTGCFWADGGGPPTGDTAADTGADPTVEDTGDTSAVPESGPAWRSRLTLVWATAPTDSSSTTRGRALWAAAPRRTERACT